MAKAQSVELSGHVYCSYIAKGGRAVMWTPWQCNVSSRIGNCFIGLPASDSDPTSAQLHSKEAPGKLTNATRQSKFGKHEPGIATAALIIFTWRWTDWTYPGGRTRPIRRLSCKAAPSKQIACDNRISPDVIRCELWGLLSHAAKLLRCATGSQY